MITSTPSLPKLRSPLKLLLMGQPGARKTTLMLQFPSVHVLDCDRNLDGPESWIRKNINKELSYSFDPIRYDEQGQPVDVNKCYDRLCDKLKLIKVSPDYKQVKTVGMDSLSHFNEFVIRYVLSLQRRPGARLGEMEIRDWGPFGSYAIHVIVGLLEETGRDVICTCHETKITEPDPSNMMNKVVTGLEPFFQGKVGDSLGGFFTDVWRLEQQPAPGGKSKTTLQTMRSANAKCEFLKNSLSMPAEMDITEGYKIIEPYIKARM